MLVLGHLLGGEIDKSNFILLFPGSFFTGFTEFRDPLLFPRFFHAAVRNTFTAFNVLTVFINMVFVARFGPEYGIRIVVDCF